MSISKVLVVDQIEQSFRSKLEEAKMGIVVDVHTNLSASELLKEVAEVDAIVVRSRTQITAAVINAGKRLKVIARAGVGIDNIDVEYARRKGIAVINAPAGNTISAAEHTCSLILAVSRKLIAAHVSLCEHKVWKRAAFLGVEVADKVLGLVGLGRVGKAVAKRMRAFDMRIAAFDPCLDWAEIKVENVKPVDSFEELAKMSDYISFHTPLTNQTKHMLGSHNMHLLKRSAFVINCARGGLVDEDALYEALNKGLIAGAAIDVFATEPLLQHNLTNLPNVIATPHIGASTIEAQQRVAEETAEKIIQYNLHESKNNSI